MGRMHDKDLDDLLDDLRNGTTGDQTKTSSQDSGEDPPQGTFDDAIEYLEYKDHKIKFPIREDVPPSAVKQIFSEEMSGFNNETVLSGVDDFYSDSRDAYAKGLVSDLLERSLPLIPVDIVKQHFPDLVPVYSEDGSVSTVNHPEFDNHGALRASIGLSILESAGVPWSCELILDEDEDVWEPPFSGNWIITSYWPCIGVRPSQEDEFERGLLDARGTHVESKLDLVGPVRMSDRIGFYQFSEGLAGVAEPLKLSNYSSDAHNSHIHVKTVGDYESYSSSDTTGSVRDDGSTTTRTDEISFCPECGEELLGFSSPSFCPHCGDELQET